MLNLGQTISTTTNRQVFALHLALVVDQQDAMFEKCFDASVAQLFADHEVVRLPVDPDDVSDVIDAAAVVTAHSLLKNRAIAINALVVLAKFVRLLFIIIQRIALLAVVALHVFVQDGCHRCSFCLGCSS